MTSTAPETPLLRTARLRVAGAAIVAVIAIVLTLDLGRALPLQQAWFDELQRLSPRAMGITPVTIVEIDDKSLKDLGPCNICPAASNGYRVQRGDGCAARARSLPP